MKKDKKATAGILSLVLWAVLLTVIARLLTYRGGWDFSGILFKVLLWVMQCIAIFFCWWIFAGLRLNRFIKRLNEAGYTYLETHGVDVYLREIDICCEMPGAKNAVISGIPARDYVMILGPVHINQMCGFPSKFSQYARQKFAGVLTVRQKFLTRQTAKFAGKTRVWAYVNRP